LRLMVGVILGKNKMTRKDKRNLRWNQE